MVRPMRPVRGAVGLLAGLVLVACSSGAADEPERTTSTSAATSEAAATPTESTPAPPQMPPEAREATPEGAAAFVRHFFQLVNYAYATGDTEPLRRASHSDCETCASVVDQVEQRYSTGGRISGGEISVVSAQAGPIDDVGISLVTTAYDQASLTELDADGNVVTTGSGEDDSVIAFYAEFAGDEWRAFGITDE